MEDLKSGDNVTFEISTGNGKITAEYIERA